MRTAVIYNFLIEANIMASIAILLMVAVRRFLRPRLGNRAIRFGWLLVAVRLLVPLSLPNPWIWTIRTPMQPDTAIRPMAGQVQIRFRDAVSDLRYLVGSRFGEKMPLARELSRLDGMTDNGVLSGELMAVCAAGMLAVLAWFVFANVRFRLRLKAARIGPIDGELKEEYEAMCHERGVRPVPVYFTDPLPSACLVGVFRPYIALPLSARPAEAIRVLTHEVCHLKGLDHIWNLVRLLCVAIHWFNPLVWAAAAMSRTDSELACDDRVAGPMDRAGRKAYAEVLVLAASRRTSPGLVTMATGMTMTGRTLRQRVAGIVEEKRISRVLAFGFMGLALVCLLGAFSTSDGPFRVYGGRLFGSGVQTDFLPDRVSHAGRAVDAEGLERLMTDEKARQEAVEAVFASGYVLEEKVTGPFSAVRDELTGDVSFFMEDGEEVLRYGADGRLLQMLNPYGAFTGHDYILSGYDLWNDSEAEALRHYLGGFITDLSPQAGSVTDFYNMGEWTDGAGRYVDFAFRYPGGDGEERMGMFSLELLPQTRIVYYLDSPRNPELDSLVGNG